MTDSPRGRLHSLRLRLGRVERGTWKRIGAVAVAAFALGYALTALVFIQSGDRPEVVSVPDLRSLNVREARERLDDLGLELQLGDSLPHPRVPLGDILAQSPLPGREVAPGSSVRVMLSAGRPQGPVPDVTSMTQEPATRLLAASGFQVRVQEVPDRLPRGRVIATEPVPGTMVRLPAVIQLRVSAGPPMVAVPELLGRGEDEARLALESAGLRLGDVEYQFDELGSYEMVVDQNPLPGDSIRMGAAVHVRLVTNRPRNE